MNIKIFKTILMIFICFGITVPSNAAVSVSDNSAFMTKAEALAVAQSLSERIIALENTMDEKIDNLITAYLERNGVWNAQEQTRQNFIFTVGPSWTQGTSGSFEGYEDLVKHMFVRTTTRSGIFSSEIRYRGTNYGGTSNMNECRIGYKGKTSSTYSDNTFDITCSIYEDNTDGRLSHTATNFLNYSSLRYTILIGSSFGQRRVSNSANDFIACMNMPINDMVRPITFFVQKNSSLWWIVRSRYKIVNATDISSVSRDKTGSSSGGQIYLSILDARIN